MTHNVLVLNSGSSSIKYQLIELPAGQVVAKGKLERIGEHDSDIVHTGPSGRFTRNDRVADHAKGMRLIMDVFAAHGPDLADVKLAAVGHRVVHGGIHFSAPTVITDEVCEVIDSLSALAPLHNPANLIGITVARRMFPDTPHVAVFDTAFHTTLPAPAYTYAVPRSWRQDHHVRRYGFHGTSHAYVSRQAAKELRTGIGDANVIVLHLGNGASVSAVRGGICVDTSMGLTPLEGLVMGTRSGDLDPAAIFHMHRSGGLDYDEIDSALNRDSGLLGLAGDNDMRQVLAAADSGDGDAILARDTYCYRIKKYIGSYTAALGRVDAIAFTAGVGENSPDIRARSLAGLGALGIELDLRRNAAGDRRISTAGSPVAVLVIPTDEELEIATQSLTVVA